MPCPNCPTCGRAMQSVVVENGAFLCGQCGTLIAGERVHVPDLVGRCRDFETELAGLADQSLMGEWRSIGLSESINTPENRP